MQWLMRITHRRAALALTIALLGVAGIAAKEESLKTTMHGVLDRLGAILPLALGSEPLGEAERQEFETRLAELMQAADRIEAHGQRRDAGFRFLGRSLNDDLRGVQRSWQRGEEDSARYFLVGATANCVACHSRLPSHYSAPSLAKALEPHIESDKASPHERAQLLVATRQFTRALDTWEAAFTDPEMTAAELDFGGYLLDYLTIAVRVEALSAGAPGALGWPARALHGAARARRSPGGGPRVGRGRDLRVRPRAPRRGSAGLGLAAPGDRGR
jgi:hypothetical protein